MCLSAMISGRVRFLRGARTARGLAVALLCAACGLFVGSDAFWPAAGPLSIASFHSSRTAAFPERSHSLVGRQDGTDGRGSGRRARHTRTQLFESISENRAKITRAMNSLRDALRSGDEELAERLKAFIMHLRQRDPQYATQDAMDDAVEKGLFSTAAKLKIKLTEIQQNPFRQSLLDVEVDGDSGGGGSSDISEDMTWGFDQSFFGEDNDGSDEDEDYDEI